MRINILSLFILNILLCQCQSKKESQSDQVEQIERDSLIKSVQTVEGVGSTSLEKKFREGIDFYAGGSEPSWSLDFFQQDMISFKSMTEVAQLATPLVTRTSTDELVLSYKAEMEVGSMLIEITKNDCVDPMSGKEFPYSVMVSAKNGDMADFKEFSGCGRYVPDYRLSGKWLLQSLSGHQLSEHENDNRPYLELDIAELKVTGNNGCNRIMGGFVNEGSTLSFPELASTRMACPGDLSSKVDQVLNEVTGYELNDGQLQMTSDGLLLSTWTRVENN